MQGRGIGSKLKVGGGHILQSEFPYWTQNLPLEWGGQKQKEIPPPLLPRLILLTFRCISCQKILNFLRVFCSSK